jgi:3-oxoacyl-[acyl-carrier-protein] synthase II
MFIKSASHIGHSECTDLESWLTGLEPIEHEQPLVEPDYKSTLNPRLLRRMSPILKLGSYSALDCLSKTDNAIPNAIIVGSGLGCSTDTLTFLNEMNTNLNAALSPTAFIRSTHNTVAGQIALLLKNQGYNMTFTQGSLSFESALSDAQMAMGSGEIESWSVELTR